MANSKKENRIEEITRNLVKPVIESHGFKLWDVCFEKEGAMWYLRVLFDKEGGIDSDDCEALTEPVNKIIDSQDFISNIDIVEVGSPGLTKKLRLPEHFISSINTPVRVVMRGDKGKEFSIYGILKSFDEKLKTFIIDDNGHLINIKLSDCVKVNSNL